MKRSSRLTRVPKKKMMTGRDRTGDVYVTSRGSTLIYTGTKKSHFNNPKYWSKS